MSSSETTTPSTTKPSDETVTTGDVVLKGGHAPAEKIAGGVRIARKEKRSGESGDKAAKEDEEIDEKPNPNDDHKLIISGVVAHGDRDFPDEAIKAYHQKPLPTKEPPHEMVNHAHNHFPHNHFIQQPRKQ